MAQRLAEGRQQYTDNAGNPLIGGKLYTYNAGPGTAPRVTYSDAAGTVPNTFPIILDARGEATVFWSGVYKVVLCDPSDVVIWTEDNITANGIDTTLLALTSSASNGAGMIGYNSTLNYPIGTVGNRLGEWVDPCDYPFLADKTGAVECTGAVQAAVNTGKEVRFPSGRYKMGEIHTPARGVKFTGSGMGATVFEVIAGTKGIVISSRNLLFQDIEWQPPGMVTGDQSNTVADCFTVQGASDDEYIEAITWRRCAFYNIKGCAVRIISPLRESLFDDCRFQGMGNVATGDGPVHCDNPGTSNRSLNNITFRSCKWYRYGTPCVSFKLTGSDATGRTETPVADVTFFDCLFHGQQLKESDVIGDPSVQPMPTHTVYMKGTSNVRFLACQFKAVHQNFNGIRIDSMAGMTGVNAGLTTTQSLTVDNNYMSYGVNNPLVVGPTGGYIRVTDMEGGTITNNKLRPGIFTYDIDLRDSGASGVVLKAFVVGNKPFLSTLPLTYNFAEWIVITDDAKLSLIGTAPEVYMRDVASAAYIRQYGDAAGSYFAMADPTGVVSATHLMLGVDGVFELDITGGQVAVKRINFSGTFSDGTASNGSLYLSSTAGGALTVKDLGGTVRRITTTP